MLAPKSFLLAVLVILLGHFFIDKCVKHFLIDRLWYRQIIKYRLCLEYLSKICKKKKKSEMLVYLSDIALLLFTSEWLVMICNYRQIFCDAHAKLWRNFQLTAASHSRYFFVLAWKWTVFLSLLLWSPRSFKFETEMVHLQWFLIKPVKVIFWKRILALQKSAFGHLLNSNNSKFIH